MLIIISLKQFKFKGLAFFFEVVSPDLTINYGNCCQYIYIYISECDPKVTLDSSEQSSSSELLGTSSMDTPFLSSVACKSNSGHCCFCCRREDRGLLMSKVGFEPASSLFASGEGVWSPGESWGFTGLRTTLRHTFIEKRWQALVMSDRPANPKPWGRSWRVGAGARRSSLDNRLG
jgi:hypothetical protein